MVAYNGAIATDGLSVNVGTIRPYMGQKNAAPITLDGAITHGGTAGARTNNAPVDRTGPQSHSAANREATDSYGFLDWFNKLHFETLNLTLGPVVSVQVRGFYVYSSYLEEDRTLNSITPANDIGLTLTEPAPTPLVWKPQDEKTYELTVDTDGPPTVEASYLFDFDTVDVTVRVVGIRVIGWQHEPAWTEPVVERLEWRTDVIRKYDGSEQRIQVRETPRQIWEFSFFVDGAERRDFESKAFRWSARPWALPVWSDGAYLEADAPAGAGALSVTTATLGYSVGGLGLLIADDGVSFEAFEVAAIGATSITLDRPLVNGWPRGTRVYPARIARLTQPVQAARMNRDVIRGTAAFTTEIGVSHPAATETLYRGYPILDLPPNMRDGLEYRYEPKTELVESPSGVDFLEDESGVPDLVQALRWTLQGRAELDAFRRFLYARAGRAKGLWVPTFAEDLILKATVSDTSLNIDVEAQGLATYVAADSGRRDIRMELLDGTVFLRRVSGFVEVDAETERMTIDAALGRTVFPSDVRLISWVSFARLDADSVEIAWENGQAAESVTVLKVVRNDV